MEKDSQDQKLIHIHRGIIGTVSEGMNLPVGGSIFHEKLTTKLHLDFHNFEKISIYKIEEIYTKQKESFEKWYTSMPEDLQKHLDAKTFFILLAIQNGIKKRLNINDLPSIQDESRKRSELYAQKTIPNLSDFANGQSFCAERAALGQYLLQEIGIPSLYMSGVSYYENIDDGADHSWIILFPDTERSLIWDIARPHQNYPNIYSHEGGINTQEFQGTDNSFIKTHKLLATSERYFGVSDNPNMTDEGFSPQIISQKISNILS